MQRATVYLKAESDNNKEAEPVQYSHAEYHEADRAHEAIAETVHQAQTLSYRDAAMRYLDAWIAGNDAKQDAAYDVLTDGTAVPEHYADMLRDALHEALTSDLALERRDKELANALELLAEIRGAS